MNIKVKEIKKDDLYASSSPSSLPSSFPLSNEKGFDKVNNEPTALPPLSNDKEDIIKLPSLSKETENEEEEIEEDIDENLNDFRDEIEEPETKCSKLFGPVKKRPLPQTEKEVKKSSGFGNVALVLMGVGLLSKLF